MFRLTIYIVSLVAAWDIGSIASTDSSALFGARPGPLAADRCWPMFRVRLETDQERERETIIVLLLFGLKQEPADLADLGSDIVSKLVKVTIGNMLVN